MQVYNNHIQMVNYVFQKLLARNILKLLLLPSNTFRWKLYLSLKTFKINFHYQEHLEMKYFVFEII